MPRFSFPAFLITDLLALRRDAGRRVALMDGVVAGASGSVMLGVILGALAKPRQRGGPSAAPFLTAQPFVTPEGDNAVFLSWSTVPGATGYNVTRALGGAAAITLNEDALVSPPTAFLDDGSSETLKAKTAYTYTVNAILSSGNVSSNSVTVTTLGGS